jgi:hypothetical protein
MRFAGFFSPRLGFAQGRVLRFQLGCGALNFQRHPLPLGLGFTLFEQPQNLLALHHLLVQRVVTTGDLGLRLQALHLAAQFEADILDAGQVFPRIFQSTVGFLAPLLVAGDAGRFFEKDAQIIRLGLDNPRNHALADDGVCTRPQTGAKKEIGNVLAPDLQIIDEIIRLPLSGQRALDRQFGKLRPLAQRPAEQIVENQLDGSARYRFAAGRPVEDDVHHRFAAQLGSFRLAQHPAHGVHDVGFAAAVRPDDADQLPGQGNGSRIDKGFEAGEFEFGQAHANGGRGETPCL